MFGRIVRFESNYDRFRPQLKPDAWRERSGPGTGILFDLAPHLIDHALVLFGLPGAVTADMPRLFEDALGRIMGRLPPGISHRVPF